MSHRSVPAQSGRDSPGGVEPARILITGASGFLGYSLCRAALAAGWEVHAVARSKPVLVPGARSLMADLTDYGQLRRVLDEARPRAVVHAAAAAQPNACENDRDATRRINVGVPVNLAGLCGDLGAALAFVSTDMVFDGQLAPYSESSETDPVNEYGRQKAEAEQGVSDRLPSAAICRLPLMFGPANCQSSSFLQAWIKSLRDGQPTLKLFADEYRTPVDSRWAAEGILLALGRHAGPLHLGGPERISRLELGLLLASLLPADPRVIEACRQADVPMAAPRPQDVSLDSSRAKSLGYAPPSLETQLRELISEQKDEGRRRKEEGGE